jgi:hypothetical protein
MADIRVFLDRLFAKRDGGNAEQQVLDVRPLNSDGTVIGSTSPIGAVIATGNVASGAADSGNPVKIGGVYQTTLSVLTGGTRWDAQVDNLGNLRVRLAGAAVTAADAIANNSITSVSLASEQSNSVRPMVVANYKYNGTSWDRNRKPSFASRIVSAAASTNATLLRSSPTDLHKVVGLSKRASDCFLKLYNKATAPTVGTDTPVFTLAIPAGALFNFEFHEHFFSVGLGLALTTGSADADTAALTAGDIIGLNVTFS